MSIKSDYLKAMRKVVQLGPEGQGDNLFQACKKLYQEDFEAFMERLHELEKENNRVNLVLAKREAEEKPQQPPGQAPPGKVKDLGVEKVVAMCEELAANWKDE